MPDVGMDNNKMVHVCQELFSLILQMRIRTFFLDILYPGKYDARMEKLKQLIKKEGSKKAAADRLEISVRYIDYILNGKKPSKRLQKLINIYLAS